MTAVRSILISSATESSLKKLPLVLLSTVTRTGPCSSTRTAMSLMATQHSG